jgi:hypothetical protein
MGWDTVMHRVGGRRQTSDDEGRTVRWDRVIGEMSTKVKLTINWYSIFNSKTTADMQATRVLRP